MSMSMNMKLRVRILTDTINDVYGIKQFLNKSMEKAHGKIISVFLPKEFLYEFVKDGEEADICIFGIGLNDNAVLRDNEINILFCPEDILWQGSPKHYHYNKYNEYGNEKVDIYYYIHINKIVSTEKYLSIPIKYAYLNMYEIIKQSLYFTMNKVPFSQKKFCLNISKNMSEPSFNDISKLNNLGFGSVDHISLYNEKLINISNNELCRVYSQYKFIICLDVNEYNEYNEYNDYIVREMFHTFISYSIPLYLGYNEIHRYINEKAFVNCINNMDAKFNQIIELANDEQKYMEIIHENKINIDYTNVKYLEYVADKIKSRMMKKLMINNALI